MDEMLGFTYGLINQVQSVGGPDEIVSIHFSKCFPKVQRIFSGHFGTDFMDTTKLVFKDKTKRKFCFHVD